MHATTYVASILHLQWVMRGMYVPICCKVNGLDLFYTGETRVKEGEKGWMEAVTGLLYIIPSNKYKL